MISDEDLQKYSRYLARRYKWILQYRADYSMEDLEVMAAMGIVQAVQAEGTETRKWVYMAPLYMRQVLRDELHLYQDPGRFAMASTANKVQLDAPVMEDSETTQGELLADPDQQADYGGLLADDVQGTVRDALEAIDCDTVRQCIILHYIHRVTVKSLAQALQTTRQDIANMLARGKLQLRHNHRLRQLVEAGIDDMTPYYSHTGYAAWASSGMSAPEYLTMLRDRTRHNLEYRDVTDM